jgi:hypothetical protein
MGLTSYWYDWDVATGTHLEWNGWSICNAACLVQTSAGTNVYKNVNTPVCPCDGGWVAEGTGSETFYGCFCPNPYFYLVTGKTPRLPIEYAPVIDWQCGNFDECILPELP